MTLNKAKRAELFNMFGGKCAYCGYDLPEKGWHADHVEPVLRQSKLVRVEGGYYSYKYVNTGKLDLPENDREDNYMPSCRSCNLNKSCSSLENWRRQLERIPEGIRRDYPRYRHGEKFGLVKQVATKVVFYFERLVQNEETNGAD